MKPCGESPKVYLNPGELVICEQPTEVVTVLGSCVAVVFFARRQRLGAICHAMLPYHKGEDINEFKYVDRSVGYMLEEFRRRRVARSEIVVKLFGGADMFEPGKASTSGTVGRQNIAAARNLLEGQGLTISASDVGGGSGRKIVFCSRTGDVYLKRMKGQWR